MNTKYHIKSLKKLLMVVREKKNKYSKTIKFNKTIKFIFFSIRTKHVQYEKYLHHFN